MVLVLTEESIENSRRLLLLALLVSRIIRESESKCSQLTFFLVFILLVTFPSDCYTSTCSYNSSSIFSLISSSFSVSRILYYLLSSSSSFHSNSPFVLFPLQLLSSHLSFYSHFSFRFFEFFSSPTTFICTHSSTAGDSTYQHRKLPSIKFASRAVALKPVANFLLLAAVTN